MPKYRALVDVPPIKQGEIVTFKDPLIPEFKSKFERYTGEQPETQQTAGDNDDPVKTAIVNPNRDELKDRATKLGINFASNIPTTTLIELIQEAEAKRQDGQGEGQGDDDKDADDDKDQE